jgi:hypothetical protein
VLIWLFLFHNPANIVPRFAALLYHSYNNAFQPGATLTNSPAMR